MASKPIQAQEAFQDMAFPARGVDRAAGFGLQRPGTTPEGRNVRFFEPSRGRGRGGQRAGLEKHLDDALPDVIQDMNVVVHTSVDALLAGLDLTDYECDAPDTGHLESIYLPLYSCPTITCLETDPNNTFQVPCGGSGIVPNPLVRELPVLTWADPADITEGTPLTGIQLNATATDLETGATIPGAFVYTPAGGTMLNSGDDQTLSVSFTPTDTVRYRPVTATASINVTASGSGGTSIQTQPQPVELAFSLVAPTIELDMTVSVTPVELAFSLVPPTIEISAAPDTSVGVVPVELAFSLITPTIEADVTLEPEPVELGFSLVSPTIEMVAQPSVSPSPVTLAFSLVTPTVETDDFVDTILVSDTFSENTNNVPLGLHTPDIRPATFAWTSPAPVIRVRTNWAEPQNVNNQSYGIGDVGESTVSARADITPLAGASYAGFMLRSTSPLALSGILNAGTNQLAIYVSGVIVASTPFTVTLGTTYLLQFAVDSGNFFTLQVSIPTGGAVPDPILASVTATSGVNPTVTTHGIILFGNIRMDNLLITLVTV